MTTELSHELRLAVNRHGVVDRRGFLAALSAGGLAAGAASWTDLVGLRADEIRRQGKACILLWMQGGPSQFETFDPKPAHANGGETKAIATSVPGLPFAENLPHLAQVAGHLAVVRSATTKEGNHQRATFLLHTSHVPAPSVHYPAMGSIVGQELGADDEELPSFVRIGRRFPNSAGGGLLGSDYNPFLVPVAGKTPDNASPAPGAARFQRRCNLLAKLETAAAAEASCETAEHRGLYEKARRMILSSQMQAFDLDREPDSVRDAYGRNDFGAGCLLARRLIESGVVFVEVGLDGWDTHDDNFTRSHARCGELDQPFARLVQELHERGLLDKTLVVWMGEFGRTPRINPRAGRDHYPRAFSVVLAGGGVRGGRALGSTDDGGVEIRDRPVSAPDLFRTFYHSLGIDADKQNMSPIGRPIKIVDGGEPVRELFT